jgi:3-hydroxyacyl-CoA dehydrogenase
MKKLSIRKAAVLGAGVMGAAIAAHLAGNGIEVVLLDIPLDGGPKSRLAADGKKRVLDPKTRASYDKSVGDYIATGNFEDDLAKCADADWIIEAIIEKLEPKVDLFSKLSKIVKDTCILSSNTSGISMNAIAKGVTEAQRRYFIGTHFFNPPRYMNLLELIPIKETDPALLDLMADFGRDRLGKSIVVAADTPNFIANRIGMAGSAFMFKAIEKFNISPAGVDFLTGPLVGRPATASLRTSDMVGLDIVKSVMKTNYDAETIPAEKELMVLPAWVEELIASGSLGDKAKKGFYTKGPDKKPLMWDRVKKEYVPREYTPPAALTALDKKASMKDKTFALFNSGTPDGDFLWYLTCEHLIYCANRVPEITTDFRNIDLAMRLGYNWQLGPFQTWDDLGPQVIIDKMEKEGKKVPAWVKDHLAKNGGKFYGAEGFGKLEPKYLSISDPSLPVVKKYDTVKLLDIGDGVGCIVLMTPNSSLSAQATKDITQAIKDAEQLCVAAVIASNGRNFCVGADLKDLLEAIKVEAWDGIDASVKEFHGMANAIKFARIPLVAAPFNMALGGGAEICMNAHKVVAHTDLYMGLVEVGVGLIPAGGGLKEMAMRTMEPCRVKQVDTLPLLGHYFQHASSATVSGSALHAVQLGFLRPTDRLVPHLGQLIDRAKEEALALSKSWKPVIPTNVTVYGTTGFGMICAGLHNMVMGQFISEYDVVVSKQVARALTGGDVPAGYSLPEGRLQDLEREGFVYLCKQAKTRERIEGMMTTGRPVRN